MNKEVISKELLCEVLSVILQIMTTRENILLKENTISYTFAHESTSTFKEQEINIHELAHICKDWAWNKHLITIRSGFAEFGAWSNFSHNHISFVSMNIPLTEPEAIFKACQWILDNKEE